MPKAAQKVVRFKMTFPADVLGEPFMYKLAKEMKVVPNIKRGRVSDKNAWLEIEISGTEKNIEKAVTYLKSKGVSVSSLGA